MSKVVTLTDSYGNRFDILKGSVAGILMQRNGNAVIFTTGGKITINNVLHTADELREMLLGGEDDD